MHLARPLFAAKVDDSQDYVQIYIDPRASRRSAFLLRVNPRGVQTDGIHDEVSNTEILDPDFDWDVATKQSADSWTAEFAIPLSTLRVSKRGAQDWVVLVYRGLNRRQDHQFASAPIPRVSNCFLCYAGTLHFENLTPRRESLFVTATAVAPADRPPSNDGHRATLGPLTPSADVQWLPYSGAVLDLTAHPDFTDVDPDDVVLAANSRFAIFLPEKRPFFLEATDLTTTPIPILYTRNIVSPTFGGGLTQRSDSLNGTVFVSGDNGDGSSLERGLLESSIAYPVFASSAGYGRVRLAAGDHSEVGVVAALKENSDGSYNEVGGVDAEWNANFDRVSAQLVSSRTRDPDLPDLLSAWHGELLSGNAGTLQWDHTADWSWTLRQSFYDNGFRAWLGYVPRVGYDESYIKFSRQMFFDASAITALAPYILYDDWRLAVHPVPNGPLSAGLQP